MKRIIILLLFAAQAPGGDPIDKFFVDYTAEWIRGNPNASTTSRYFTGQEQDRLERQLTLETDAYRRSRIKLAQKGITELRKFDRAKMSDVQRVSTNLLEWQLTGRNHQYQSVVAMVQ